MPPIVLAYWDIRALAQPIRLLLEHSGLEWEDKFYATGPPPDYEKKIWYSEKPNLPVAFPNLPYLYDGEVKLSQSTAILRYLARKTKLDGTTEEEKQRMDLIESEIHDIRSAFIEMCYNPYFEMLKGPYLQNLHGKLQQISKFLGSRPFFAGPNLTYVDFLVYENLDEHKVLSPECLKGFANLEAFLERIEGLPKIAAFMKSPRFIKDKLLNKSSQFGG